MYNLNNILIHFLIYPEKEIKILPHSITKSFLMLPKLEKKLNAMKTKSFRNAFIVKT